MKKLLAILACLAVVSLTGCRTTGSSSPDSKQVARIKSRALNVGGFLANLAGNILVNSATNFVNEKLGNEVTREPRELRGFRK